MSQRKILMVAAENAALPGAKVGGVGDVLNELPRALQSLGCDISTVIPSYGFLARLEGAEYIGSILVSFAGREKKVDVLSWRKTVDEPLAYILHHADFAPQGEVVYCHDDDRRPFATDATKYAFFCESVAQALVQGLIGMPDILHCHDWHSAFLLILLRLNPRYANLSSLRSVYSIHNLAMQGVRPFRDDPSSLLSWFPDLINDYRSIADRAAPDCVNPMLAGIVMADCVHTVSPSYAQEILQPSDHDHGIYGGEGLERDLQHRADEGQLIGILNGCEYPKNVKVKKTEFNKASFIATCEADLLRWASAEQDLKTAYWLAEKRLSQWKAKRSRCMLLTSVGRVTEQKVRLLLTPLENGELALDAILAHMASRGTLVMLGSGHAGMEESLLKVSARHKNFIFLSGYSERIASALYEAGDLFLMPSSFEPCGISQLLAMRSGQPCLANAVGGLKDTIVADRNGFLFSGVNALEQAKNMVDAFKEALRVYLSSDDIWQSIKKSAAKQRFSWDRMAQEYIDKLYS